MEFAGTFGAEHAKLDGLASRIKGPFPNQPVRVLAHKGAIGRGPRSYRDAQQEYGCKLTDVTLYSQVNLHTPSLLVAKLREPMKEPDKEEELQRYIAADICSIMEGAYVRAKTRFGPPLQETYAYKLDTYSASYRPWIYVQDVAMVGISLFSSQENGYAVIKRTNRKFIGEAHIRYSFSPADAEREDAKIEPTVAELSNFSGDIFECTVTIEVGKDSNEGVNKYTNSVRLPADYRPLK